MMGFSEKGYKNEVELGRAFITIPKCVSAGKEIKASGGTTTVPQRLESYFFCSPAAFSHAPQFTFSTI